jgi:hypothetical protein
MDPRADGYRIQQHLRPHVLTIFRFLVASRSIDLLTSYYKTDRIRYVVYIGRLEAGGGGSAGGSSSSSQAIGLTIHDERGRFQ